MVVNKKTLSADLVVVGGGLAGLCAAVAAARNGISVVLVQDRPMLGGNSSSEIRMWVCGAHGRDGKETGLIEELLLENYRSNPSLRYSLWDGAMYTFAVREPNLKLLLNTSVDRVVMDGGVIAAVKAWGLTDYTEYTVNGRFFADCSGDSILRLSGAQFRVGREAASEFGESHAPAHADRKTMGNSIMLQLRRAKTHRNFIAPEWAYHFTEETFLRRKEVCGELKNENFWWMEFGGECDTIRDADEIRHELLRIAYGVWEYLKNNRVGDAEQWELDWIGSLPGKRESFRYVGAHTMTQTEIENGGHYPDVVAHGGWSMDDHNPKAFFTAEPATIYHPAPSPYGIPYRALYSANVPNLFFAGRNISVTHMALSSTRVMATGATLGQAVGTAAAIAVKQKTTADGVYRNFLPLLKKTLSDQDQYLIDYHRSVPEMTLRAKATREGLRSGVERMRAGEETGEVFRAGESAQYTFDAPTEITRIRLVFDSDLDDLKRMRNYEAENDEVRKMPEMLVKSYRVEVRENGEWRELFSDAENWRRLVLRDVPATECDAVRLTVESGYGARGGRVFSFEVS